MKRPLLLLVLSLLIHPVWADEVTEEKALSIAQNVFATQAGTIPRLRVACTSQRLVSVVLRNQSEKPAFYLITPQSEPGFVIVSAEDRVMPVIGYSTQNTFKTDGIPLNIQHFLDCWKKQIDLVRQSPTEATPEVHAAWNTANRQSWKGTRTTTDKKQLKTADWNQYNPYNLYCPTYGGSRCITGCVATAIGIVMHYYTYPLKGYGTTDPYTTETNSIDIGARNLENHTYNWNAMPYVIDNSTTTDQGKAIALLLADIGAAIQADYGPSLTTANVNLDKLYTHFKYSPAMRHAHRADYTNDQWQELIQQEINQARPILYNSLDLYHEFIIDGYNGNQLHVNWGWGGYNNGNYSLTQIGGPEDDHYMVQNFCPPTGTFEPNAARANIGTYITESSPDSYYASIGGYFCNTSMEEVRVNLYVTHNNKAGKVKSTECIGENLTIPNYDWFYYDTSKELHATDIELGDKFVLSYTVAENDFYKANPTKQTVAECLVYDDTSVQAGTSFTYDQSSKKITLKVPTGYVKAQVLDSRGDCKDSVLTQDGQTLTIDTRPLRQGTYTLRLTRFAEVYNLTFTVKPL